VPLPNSKPVSSSAKLPMNEAGAPKSVATTCRK
jgi:hypothetical protein